MAKLLEIMARRIPARFGLVSCAGKSWQSGRADAEVQMPYQRRSALVLSEAERDELGGWAGDIALRSPSLYGLASCCDPAMA